MKRVYGFAGLSLLSGAAAAQLFGVIPQPEFDRLVAGLDYDIGWMDFTGEQNPKNRIYLDSDVQWSPGDFPEEFLFSRMIHPPASAADTTGPTNQISFDLGDDYYQVVVWHADAVPLEQKPLWLTSGYNDCGWDAVVPGGVLSAWCTVETGIVTFSGNWNSVAGTAPMYVASIRPAAYRIGPPDSAGEVRFLTSAVSVQELTDDNLVGYHERITGGYGAVGAEVVDTGTGTCNPADYTLTKVGSNSSWASGELGLGDHHFSLDTEVDLAANCTIVLGFTNLTGWVTAAAIGGQQFITVEAGTSIAQNYYVNGVSGNDLANGLSPATAWRTLGRANGVSHPGEEGHVFINVLEGPVRGPWRPQHSGLGNLQRIILTCVGTTNKKWYGPTTGTNNYFFEANGRSFISIARGDEGCLLDLDAQCSVTKNGGQPTGCRVNFLALVDTGGDRCFEFKTTNTNGYRGVRYGDALNSTAVRDTWSVELGRHGQLYTGGTPGDWGDLFSFGHNRDLSNQPYHRITGQGC